MKQRKFEARYRDGLLETLDDLPLRQGQRVWITVEPCDPPLGTEAAQDQFSALAGAWQGLIEDPEALKREIQDAGQRPASGQAKQ